MLALFTSVLILHRPSQSVYAITNRPRQIPRTNALEAPAPEVPTPEASAAEIPAAPVPAPEVSATPVVAGEARRVAHVGVVGVEGLEEQECWEPVAAEEAVAGVA